MEAVRALFEQLLTVQGGNRRQKASSVPKDPTSCSRGSSAGTWQLPGSEAMRSQRWDLSCCQPPTSAVVGASRFLMCLELAALGKAGALPSSCMQLQSAERETGRSSAVRSFCPPSSRAGDVTTRTAEWTCRHGLEVQGGN